VSDSAADGKADNYYSPVGQEYDVAGTVTLQLSTEDLLLAGAARQARLTERVASKSEQVTQTLDARLWEIWPEARRQSSEKVVIMMRAGSTTQSGLKALGDGAYEFTYRAEVAGPAALLQQLPLEEGARLDLDVPDDSGTQTIALRFKPSAQTANSYPRYLELFKNGMEITIHVGGDHLTPRHDLVEAQAIYDSLVSLGLRSPVARFEDLKIDSAPFSGLVNVAGRAVAVHAYLFHADMAPDDQLERLLDAFKKRVKTADVVIYRGHAGPQIDYSGVVVHYNPRVALPATEFRTLELPQKYQLFLFDGCETYTGYADQIFAHPSKTEVNADVITSVNYASSLKRAESVSAFLESLLARRYGMWLPNSWAAMLKQMNEVQTGPWLAIYGVHGLRDNPHLSPLADPASIGMSCEVNDDCPSIDSLCVKRSNGTRTCGAACTDSSGCPAGSRCQPVTATGLSDFKQCLSLL